MQKYISLLISVTWLLTSCDSTKNKNIPQQEANQGVLSLFPLDNYSQNITQWINPDDPHYNTPLLNTDIQQKHFKLFYEHVYGELSPWNKNYVNKVLHKTSSGGIVTIIKDESIKFNNRGKTGKEISYGENFRPYTPAWADKITDNINITPFGNLNYSPDNRAIAVSNLYVRDLPTNDVNFYSNKIAGQGYPFDNLQMSSVWAGTPLYIIGTIKDKNWSLIMVSDVIGWVESNGIAKVSSNFVNKWQEAVKLKLAAITCTQTSIVDLEGQFLFTSYIGSVEAYYWKSEALKNLGYNSEAEKALEKFMDIKDKLQKQKC
ncbi:SH3 domain-containing protein [Rickettsia endosymbiont of Polydrusus tereticollis]|uniref:SH3 domain-containing protein n=1 Tax=Rickettsia endosymbiont of Polydrusus tereticollis TaxID=3066251 RepID=UPI0031329877